MYIGRVAVPLILISMVVLGLPACEGPCGDGAPLATVSASAAERATSCIARLNFEGRQYTPWCLPVQPALLLDTPLLRGGELGTNYEARLIEGVRAEQAIAVATWYADGSDGLGDPKDKKDCGGKWRFAPENQLADADAKAIAKRVAIPGTLNLS